MKQTIIKIAGLAKLNLSEEKVVEYSGKAQKILDYMKKLNELDESSFALKDSNTKSRLEFRDDAPVQFPMKNEILKNSPELKGPFIKVPQIIDEG